MTKKYILKAVASACALLMLLGIFAGCAHTHEYKDGVCTVCRRECGHNKYTGGVCDVCGIVCKHESYTDGVCGECGTKCENHEYFDGECEICGKVCGHKEYKDGICKECGIECEHENYVDGVCDECGMEEEKPEEKPSTGYGYVPHIETTLPRIDVTSDDGEFEDATSTHRFDMNDPTSKKDWQYEACKIKLTAADGTVTAENLVAGIKVRGNYTTNYPKKPFRIKFDKKQPMFGMNGEEAKCKSWVLLADYKDPSMERNSTAFYLAKQILGSDGYYSTDFRQVELYLDGTYWGVYLLAEQQQVNEYRVNISEADDKVDPLNTRIGYLLEYDGYYNFEIYNERFKLDYNSFGQLRKKNGQMTSMDDRVGFAIKNDVYEDETYPEGDARRYPQKTFIKNYMTKLYELCYKAVYNNQYYTFNADNTGLISYTPVTDNPVRETVSKVIDIQSLVDTYILNEITCDADIAWSSFYMDVDFAPEAKDRLLRFEAPWDFDSALGLKDSCASGEGLFAANSENPWLIIFINESWFWGEVQAKWQEMTAAKVQQNTLKLIRDLRETYSAYYEKNYNTKWGFRINGEATWWIQQNVKNNAQAVNQLYDWVETRFNYLDNAFA